MINVLFVNHRTKECGVQAFGERYYAAFKETKKYTPFYIDVEEMWEFRHWFEQLKPAAVIYNFYPSTMGWLSNELINSLRPHCKQLGIYHEIDITGKGFDLILHQNPISTDSFAHWSLPRSIPIYTHHPYRLDNEIPVFGSFGFGLGGKGFSRLVKMVAEEYEIARIHLHIPFAHFGDESGVAARAHAADAMREVEGKNGIFLTIDHSFWSEERLLEWLAYNTCNAFLYDAHIGRGLSGSPDYAFAVKRPVAITKSMQFRNIWSIDDSFCIENHTLHEIIAMGTEPTDKFRKLWSREALVASFEAALESIGVTP